MPDEPTIRQLDDAIDNVLGIVVANALRRERINRHRLHGMACMKAFTLALCDRNADILRQMMVILDRDGQYPNRSEAHDA